MNTGTNTESNRNGSDTMSRTETTPTGPPSCDTSSVSSDDGTCTLPVSVCSSDTPDSPPESSSMSAFSEMFPESSEQPPPLKSYKLVGDNIDKNIRPRDMRIDHQGRSLHYFHTYAVQDRVDLSNVSDVQMSPDLSTTNLLELLPTFADHETLMQNFAILTARVIKKHMPFFAAYGKPVESHIQHACSSEMSLQSKVVC